MSNVHNIEDQRPHVMIIADDGCHVLPKALLESVVKGEKESSILTEPVVRRIIEEWLELTK